MPPPLLVFVAHVNPRPGHALAHAALVDEGGFEGLDLALEQVGAYLDEGDHGIGADFGIIVLDGFLKGLVSGGGAARVQFAQAGYKAVVFGPEGEFLDPQEVFVVELEFFEACAGHVGEFDFHFLAGCRRHACLGNVLLAAAGGLHHLPHGAVVLVEEAVCEIGGTIINDLGLLIAEQLAVAAVGGDEAFRVIFGVGHYFAGIAWLWGFWKGKFKHFIWW